MPTLWKQRKRKRRRPHSTRPIRPEFLQLRHDREELLRRRKHYIHEYARILNKLKFRERVVRELLRTPGGPPVIDWHAHKKELDAIQTKTKRTGIKLKGKEKRLIEQFDMMSEHQVHLDECQLLFFSFQFELHGRAAVHVQKIWRGCVTRPPFYRARYQSRIALATAFVALHKIPWLQPNIAARIAVERHHVFLVRRKASFRISFTMKRHVRIMKTLRYVHPMLDKKIILHQKKIVACKFLQKWWREYTEKVNILKRALAYSSQMRAEQAERDRSVEDQGRHEAAKVLQEWTGHIMVLKHNYVSKVFRALHQTMRNRLLKIDLRDTFQSDQLLRRLVDEDVEKQTQKHLAHVLRLQHVVNTKPAPSRARGRARVEEEGYLAATATVAGGPEESIVLDADEFPSDGAIPPTVLPYTGLFPNLDPDHILQADEVAGTKWTFWIGIERLNKDLWIPELVREDRELNVMARSLITWYIGENEPIVQKLSVGKVIPQHKYLAPLKRMYKRGGAVDGGGIRGGGGSGSGGSGGGSKGGLNHFVWFAPETMCPQCSAFLDGCTLPDGRCGVCGLPPHYTRNDRKITRMGNRYHVTTSYTSLRLDVDLFVVHAMYRCIALRSHYASSQGSHRVVPVYEAWNNAIKESKPIISKLMQYGCTKLEHLPRIPLTSIGVPGKTVLLLRNMLWHINNVLIWAKDNSPYEMTMHPPPRAFFSEEEELRLQQEESSHFPDAKEARRPMTAPARPKRRAGKKTTGRRPKSSPGGGRKKNGRGPHHASSGGEASSRRRKKRVPRGPANGKRPATSPQRKKKMGKKKKKKKKKQHQQEGGSGEKSALLPAVVNPAGFSMLGMFDQEERMFSPPKQYKRPSTAPNWTLGGSLVA